MSDEITRQIVRCILSGHAFDLNEDLGAVTIGKGAACTPCMDKMFSANETLRPNGDQPFKRPKPRRIA